MAENAWVPNELIAYGYKESEITIPTVSNQLESLLTDVKFIQESPIMASSSQGGYIVTSSSEFSTNNNWKAFDGGVVNWWEASTATDQWLAMQFPNPVIISRVRMSSGSANPNQMPERFKVQGSADGLVWTDLKEWIDSELWITGEAYHYDFQNTTPYKYYRVFVSTNQGGTRIAINELSFQSLPINTQIGTVVINTSETQVVASIADGFSPQGQIDYTIALPLVNDVCPIERSAYNYIFMRRNSTSGQITYEAKKIAPIYGQYQPEYIIDLPILLRGDNIATINDIVDSYGNKSITTVGSVTVSSATPKFGNGSLFFSSNGSAVKVARNMGINNDRWSIDFWWRPTTLTGNVDLVWTTPTYSILFGWGRVPSKLGLYLSSNGTSWDIASAVTGVKNFAVNTWYYINMTFTGKRYLVFVDGVQDIEVNTATQLKIRQITSLNLGAYNGEASTAPGYIDEFRFRPGVGSFYNEVPPILPTAAPVYEKPWFFNLTEMKGYEVEEGRTFTSVQMLALGEVFVRETSGWRSSSVTYAYNGRKNFSLSEFNPVVDDWIVLTHNLGTDSFYYDIKAVSKTAAAPYTTQNYIPIDSLGMYSGANTWGGIPLGRIVDRTNLKIRWPASSSADYASAYGGSGVLSLISGDAISFTGSFVRAF
jgi:hypothetical protein